MSTQKKTSEPADAPESVPDYTQIVGLRGTKLGEWIDEYARLRQQREAIEARLDELKTAGEKLYVKAGVKSAMVNGYRVTRVESYSSKLDKQKLYKLGGEKVMKWMEQATTKTPYSTLKVTAPKSETEEEE